MYELASSEVAALGVLALLVLATLINHYCPCEQLKHAVAGEEPWDAAIVPRASSRGRTRHEARRAKGRSSRHGAKRSKARREEERALTGPPSDVESVDPYAEQHLGEHGGWSHTSLGDLPGCNAFAYRFNGDDGTIEIEGEIDDEVHPDDSVSMAFVRTLPGYKRSSELPPPRAERKADEAPPAHVERRVHEAPPAHVERRVHEAPLPRDERRVHEAPPPRVERKVHEAPSPHEQGRADEAPSPRVERRAHEAPPPPAAPTARPRPQRVEAERLKHPTITPTPRHQPPSRAAAAPIAACPCPAPIPPTKPAFSAHDDFTMVALSQQPPTRRR
ncbi:hypothetical protein AB1Y20_011281 [Prymnesium parvum]|uniref:Uncharacterized protein n=1 Tax=Prymnesium parvum TaxID=97485 RepID=A0AB34IME3_PRYPA